MSENNPVADSNRDKLKGLSTPATDQASPGSAPAPSGPLPWDNKPTSAAPSPQPRAVPEPFMANLASAPTESAQLSGALPGVYPGQMPGELRYWNGASWDPRPVAGIWTRLWCWVIDDIIAVVLALAATMLLLIVPILIIGSDNGAIGILVWMVLLPLFLGYYAASYVWWGRTPGMMLGKLDVVSVRTGGRLTWGPAWLRSLVLALGHICGLMAIIWLIITASNAQRQGPHDSAAGSIVLRRL